MVRVTLPGGQRADLWVPGGLVSARAAARLARDATRDLERRARSLRKLGKAVLADHEKLSRAQQQSLERNLSKLLKGDVELSRHLSRPRRGGSQWDARERIRWLQKKTLVYPAIALSSLPLFSIFGRHNLEHNLTLVVVLAIWLFGDEMTDLLSSQHSQDSATNRSALWLYGSPLANLLAGWWLLHERQHEPIVTGAAAEFERVRLLPRERQLAASGRPARHFEQYRAVVELPSYVAKDFELDLLGSSESGVQATIGSLTWSRGAQHRRPRVESLAARVELGKLYITLVVSCERQRGGSRDLLEAAQVAWAVQVLDESSLARWA
jgi:hypothetical protein